MDEPHQLENLGMAYQLLYAHLGVLEYIEESVTHPRHAVSLIPDDHQAKSGTLNNLGTAYQQLFERLNTPECLKNAALFLCPDDHPDRAGYLTNLGAAYEPFFKTLGEQDYLQRTIDCHEKAVLLTPEDHPEKARRLNNLAGSYITCFLGQDRENYIEKSISCLQSALSLCPDEMSWVLLNLGFTYWAAYQQTNILEQACEPIGFYKSAALYLTGSPSLRIRASRHWASGCTPLKLPGLEAYTYAMTLLPLVVWLGAPVHHPYEFITSDVRGIITEAAAAALASQKYDLALEWLEQGRCFVWNLLVQLRTPFKNLASSYPDQAKQLQSLSHLLERASLPMPSSGLMIATRAQTPHEAARQHRQWTKRREGLIDEIRLLLDERLSSPAKSRSAGRLRARWSSCDRKRT
ncbi:hypothetical protein FRC12_012782 [Ceratobasidium sp. 428]|nr:hypothetical protein FRC12_012782 [Ceratobasidium sp. 428]